MVAEGLEDSMAAEGLELRMALVGEAGFVLALVPRNTEGQD